MEEKKKRIPRKQILKKKEREREREKARERARKRKREKERESEREREISNDNSQVSFGYERVPHCVGFLINGYDTCGAISTRRPGFR